MTEPKIDQNNNKHQDPNLKEGTDVELDSSTANTSDSDKDGVQTEKEDRSKEEQLQILKNLFQNTNM